MSEPHGFRRRSADVSENGDSGERPAGLRRDLLHARNVVQARAPEWPGGQCSAGERVGRDRCLAACVCSWQQRSDRQEWRQERPVLTGQKSEDMSHRGTHPLKLAATLLGPL